MPPLAAPFRRATPQDAPALAALINLAGEGLPLHLWTGMAEPGQSGWDVGRRRALREEGGFSYRNAVVAESADGGVAACLVGYALPEAPEPLDLARTPAMFVPLEELERMAPATWYVNVLATLPSHRRLGLGTRLLALAEELAAAADRRGLSIIVADANEAARRLYAANGYRLRASRPMVKEAWPSEAENWLLLTKP